MSRPRVLQIGPITPPLDAKLPDLVDIQPLWKEADQAQSLAEHGV